MREAVSLRSQEVTRCRLIDIHTFLFRGFIQRLREVRVLRTPIAKEPRSQGAKDRGSRIEGIPGYIKTVKGFESNGGGGVEMHLISSSYDSPNYIHRQLQRKQPVRIRLSIDFLPALPFQRLRTLLPFGAKFATVCLEQSVHKFSTPQSQPCGKVFDATP